MLTIRAMSNGEGYAAKHLAHSDYYAEGETVTGEWFGRASQLLGLSGEVEFKDFEAVREGLDPRTGDFLRVRHSADRRAADGSTTSHGRNLYDFTFSAPKSVSILAALTGDERLIAAHQRAVNATLQELESYAGTRLRSGGVNRDRTTGNLVIAVYHHDTSRELDPQLHTHAVAANLTWDGTENRWKALQAYPIYERRAYLTEVYRNFLAHEVRSFGYEIEEHRDSKGRDLGFQIRGVSDELVRKYSQRSEQRDQAIAAFIEVKGRQPSDNEVALLVRESRADKLIEISTAEVKARQQGRLEPIESAGLVVLRGTAHGNRETFFESPVPALDHAESHIFERVSVAKDYEVLAEALRYDRGRIELRQLQAALHLEEDTGQVLRVGHEVATRESLERERQTIAIVDSGVGVFPRLGGHNDFVSSDRLRPEQKHAVGFILNSKDRAVNLRGAAGTGKTATLQELRRGLEEASHHVLAAAPTMTAVEELQKVGFGQAVTVDHLLQHQQLQAAATGKVLIVDEASMVSGRQMFDLLRLAEQRSLRIVFSGDTHQIRSVEASDALRVLERESNLKSTSLTQVQRQTDISYREAIQELRRNPVRGFQKLEEIGAIREVPAPDRARAIEEAYREARLRPNAKGQASEVLVVSPTHHQIATITAGIRQTRKNAGELGEGIPVHIHKPLNYTYAQKTDPRNFQFGQIVEFHRSVAGIAKYEALEVIGTQGKKIVARNSKGREIRLGAKQAKAFDVYERDTIEVAAQDRLLLTANRRQPGFRATNGELVTVSGFDGKGRIQLEGGRILPPSYRQFTHGYAVTAHRSQGKTVDAVIISADSMNKELFYVSATRGRQAITVITTDRELLAHSVAESGQRLSASELERKALNTPGGGVFATPRGLATSRKAQPEHSNLEEPPTNRVAHETLLHQQTESTKGQHYGYQN